MPYRFRVLALVSSLIILMYLDRLCIAVAGPRIQEDLGLSSTDWGWLIGAFTLGYALFEVPTGMLADRLGPRRVIARIVLWWSVFTFATGMASSLGVLFLVRFLFGAGEAGAFPSTTSVISRWIPAPERGRANSVVWISSSIGGLLTPLLVVPIQQAYGWRASFLVLGVVGIVWAGIWYVLFRDSPAEVAQVSPAERALIGPYTTVPHREGVGWKRLFRNPNFLRVLAMYHAYCWGAYFYLSWLPTYLQKGRGLSEDGMKFASSATFAAGLVGVVIGGFSSDVLVRRYGLRVGRCLPAVAGLLVSGVLLAATAYTTNSRYAVLGLCLGLGAMNMMLPVTWALCLDIGRKHVGAVSGAMNMAGQAGSFISSIAFGYMVKGWGSYDTALLPLAGMLIVSGLLYLWIDPTQPLFPEPEPTPQAMSASAG